MSSSSSDSGTKTNAHLRLAFLLEARVKLFQVLVVARRLAHLHLLAREVIERWDLGRLWPGDDDFTDGAATFVERDEIDELLALVSDRHIADGDVGHALGDIRQQPIARRGSDVDGERPLAELLCVLDVQVAFEIPDQFRGESALSTFVAEIERPTIRREHPDDAAFEHLVEVAGPHLVGDGEPTRWRARVGRCVRFGGRRRPEGRSLRFATLPA